MRGALIYASSFTFKCIVFSITYSSLINCILLCSAESFQTVFFSSVGSLAFVLHEEEQTLIELAYVPTQCLFASPYKTSAGTYMIYTVREL